MFSECCYRSTFYFFPKVTWFGGMDQKLGNKLPHLARSVESFLPCVCHRDGLCEQFVVTCFVDKMLVP